MDPTLIAAVALVASAVQVLILRLIDYYFPRGHTRIGDKIAEKKAEEEVHDDEDEQGGEP